MIELELTQDGTLLRDSKVSRSIMSQQHELFLQIHGIDLRVAATHVQPVHDEHGDGIFEVAFSTTRDTFCCQ